MTSTETAVIPDEVEGLAQHILAARSVIEMWRRFLAQEAAHKRSPSQAQQVWMQAADLLVAQGHDNRGEAARLAPEKHAEGVNVGGRPPKNPGQARTVKRKDFSVYGLGPENRELLDQAARRAGVSRNKLVQEYLLDGLRDAGFTPKDPHDVDVEVSDN